MEAGIEAEPLVATDRHRELEGALKAGGICREPLRATVIKRNLNGQLHCIRYLVPTEATLSTLSDRTQVRIRIQLPSA